MSSDDFARGLAYLAIVLAILLAFLIQGPIGPVGPVGPQGPGIVVSSFASSSSPQNIPSSYTLLLADTITTTGTGYILGQANLQVANTDNVDHKVSFYLVVNGSTSNVTNEDVAKENGGVPGYSNLAIVHRSGSVVAGTYPIQLWGRYTSGSPPSPGELVVDHIDMSGLGNLA